MITITSLTSDAMQCKLLGAMRRAISGKPEFKRSFGGTAYAKNSKGRNVIRVSWHRGEGFKFYAAADSQTKCGYDITAAVIQSLRAGQ